MTAYVYNPSKKITEILAKYLEFDASQLEIAIWSGNLTISNVILKEDEFQAILKDHNLKLVDSKLGELSLKIPWKRLVWGQGDVQVSLRNVTIVLTTTPEEQNSKPEDGNTPETIQMSRKVKQRTIAEAERRLLSSKPLSSWLELVRSKQTSKPTPAKSENRLFKLVKDYTSDFIWRFCTGLQLEVQNLKVCFVQSHVELGVIVPSLVISGKASESVSSTDDHHVDDTIDKKMEIVGLGVYCKTDTPDICTSNYMLRPVDVGFDFSFYFPSRKRVKRELPIAASESVASSTTSKSKRRRGKFDKQTVETATMDVSEVTASTPSMNRSTQLSPSLRSPTRSISRRRNSAAGIYHSPQVPPRPVRGVTRNISLPLAQPELNIESEFVNSIKMTDVAKFHGKLLISEVDVLFSRYHYHLLYSFAKSAVQIKRGRPSTSVRKSPKSWWKYSIGNVESELANRRRIRKIFQETYLSFSWARQSYLRKEYVDLYIQSKLMPEEPLPTPNRLLEMEDELAIEQILLYRSIARTVHIRCGVCMPDSILELKSDRRPTSLPVLKPTIRVEEVEDRYSLAGVLSLNAEIARARRTEVKKFTPIVRENDKGFEDLASYGLGSECRTVTKIMEKPSDGILVSLSVSVQKVELNIVNDETIVEGYGFSGDESSGEFVGSDVSVLTDDERLFVNGIDTSETSEPIFSFSDFLLFKAPENILLKLQVASLDMTAFGTSGGSRNVNLSIANVRITGATGLDVFSVGASSDDVVPTPEIELRRFSSRNPIPKRALAVSFVQNLSDKFLQVDTPSIHARLDLPTITKIKDFFGSQGDDFPKPLLKPSASERLRLFVLSQNDVALSSLSCSIRVRGCGLVVPFGEESSLLFGCGMVESYSGSAVDELCAADDHDASYGSTSSPRGWRQQIRTRQLGMIDVPGMLAANKSVLSSHWVVAASGMDFKLSSGKLSQTLLSEPFDVEAFYTENSDSLVDSNRAKQEVVVEVSPINFVVEEQSLAELLNIKDVLKALPSIRTETQLELPPRLDVLSNIIRHYADVTLRQLRFTVLLESEIDEEYSPRASAVKSLEDFLRVVSQFDLSFPQEEALSAAMQICIDRLAGAGLPLEEAWEANNLVLLNFLEDIAESKDGSNGEKTDRDLVNSIIRSTVARTVRKYVQYFEEATPATSSKHVVVDFSDGVTVTLISMFYDSFASCSIPSFFVATGEGVHLLRVTAVDSAVSEGSVCDNLVDPPQDGVNDGTSGGITIRRFLLDDDHQLGKGGYPLAILGSDDSSTSANHRGREQLDDVDVGECEVTFSGAIYSELIVAFQRFLPKFGGSGESATRDRTFRSTVATVASVSSLFLTDKLLPFTRIFLSEVYMKAGTTSSTELTAQDFGVLNLSSGGELHPLVVEVLASRRKHETPSLVIQRERGSHTVHLNGARITFLKRYLNEFMQYFVSGKYGLSLMLSSLIESTEQTSNHSVFYLLLTQTSVVMPVSSSSYDLVCFEVAQSRVVLNHVAQTFTMPAKDEPLKKEDTKPAETWINRKRIVLEGVRIFYAALPDASSSKGESPSFQFFYKVSETPRNRELVYRKVAPLTGVAREVAYDERSELEWAEVTNDSAAVEVLIDYGLHQRILISDPSGSKAAGLDLDVSLTQFGRILSLWYSNMQELPVLFPYTASELHLGSGLLRPFVEIPEVGSAESRDFLANKVACGNEFMVVVQSFRLRCSLDADVDYDGSIVIVEIENAAVHVVNDVYGSIHVGAGCSNFCLVDESHSMPQFIQVPAENKERAFSTNAFADLHFGLQRERANIAEGLDLPFQLVAYLTKNWTIYTLGMDSPEFVMEDLGPIFRFLKFITAYFMDSRFGNPTFDALVRSSELKRQFCEAPSDENQTSNPLEFRLWLVRPVLLIPCLQSEHLNSAVRISALGGIWYKYSSLEFFSSQECATDRAYVTHDRFCTRDFRVVEQSTSLIQDLSLSFRLDSNSESNHTDFCIQCPSESACGVGSERVSLAPTVLDTPTVCVPYVPLRRRRQVLCCDVTCVVELLPSVSATVLGFFGMDPKDKGDDDTTQGPLGTTSVTADLHGIRVFALDPVLGPHLPIAVVSLDSVSLTSSQFSLAKDVDPTCPDEDHQFILEGFLWADYFKLGQTRSWEPLIEPYRFQALFERSRHRGVGISFNSDNNIHLNISSALLGVIDEVSEVLGGFPTSTRERPIDQPTGREPRSIADAVELSMDDGAPIHALANTLNTKDRVAFSLQNLSGDRIRILQQGGADAGAAEVVYVQDQRRIKLDFLPSVSMIKNLEVAEVSFPGFNASSTDENIPAHKVDVQVPGFRWVRGLAVDTFGRQFWDLIPQSEAVQEKLANNWCLANASKLLVEVGLYNGGRQVTLRSCFSVVNGTNHGISLFMSPFDGLVSTDADEGRTIAPGDSSTVPILLLQTALLESESSLGTLWLKPAHDVSSGESDDVDVSVCSKPVELSAIVAESAAMLDIADCTVGDHAKTGMQVSCPVRSQEQLLAPQCYAIEVSRSPVVAKEGDDGESWHHPIYYTIAVYAPFVISNLLPERGRFELMHAIKRTVLWHCDLDPGQQVPVHSVGLDAPLLLFVNLGYAKTLNGEGALVHHGLDQPTMSKDGLGLKSIGKAGKAVTKQLGRTLSAIGESPDQRIQPRKVRKDLQIRMDDSVARRSDGARKGATPTRGGVILDGKPLKVEQPQITSDKIAEETTLADGLGQQLTLNIENVRGGGGQRRIAVYCRYWIMNTTEHCLKYRQENSKQFVAGTVSSPQKNGSSPLSTGRARSTYEASSPKPDIALFADRKTLFAGTPGALALGGRPGRCDVPPDEIVSMFDRTLPLERMAELSFMFNFHYGPVIALGNQRLSVQLSDGTGATKYESDWSKGISLDSIGIPQILSLHCKDGRSLELNVIVTVGPDVLSAYTKVVRFLPRYAVVNLLPFPVRLWQDSSIFRSSLDPTTDESSQFRYAKPARPTLSKVNQYEALWGRDLLIDDGVAGQMPCSSAHASALYINTISPSGIVPFNLPDSRRERQLRIDIGAPWKLSPSFSADISGDHSIKICRAVDLRRLPHVSTRSNPKYEVRLPPLGDSAFSGDLGVWFETEFDSGQSLIVKAIKKNSFAFNETDIHVGDELLAVDGVRLSKKTFGDAMKILKNRLNQLSRESNQGNDFSRLLPMRLSSHLPLFDDEETGSITSTGNHVQPFVLSFRTVEERLRIVRMKAAKASRDRRTSTGAESPTATSGSGRLPIDDLYIRAELKAFERSDLGTFLVLREEKEIPFLVQNQSLYCTLYYRQRGCAHHPWQKLNAGESRPYCWEEPLKTKRLSVRVTLENNRSASDRVNGSSRHLSWFSHRPTDPSPRRRIGAFRKVKDEDSIYSSTLQIRLEEIGFQEYLSVGEPGAEERCLVLDVDVQGSTRVLIAQDRSFEDGVLQLSKHVALLRERSEAEANRVEELYLLKDLSTQSEAEVQEIDLDNTVTVTAKDLVADILNESTVTRQNQIVVSVLEATGLTSDSFISNCNPYAEVRLKAASRKRRLLFSKRGAQKTYFIRKSVNPVWSDQSFVFDVPTEAISVTRGHSVQVCLKSYSAFGQHNILGKAQVELHCVRDQNVLEGWFPLVGRSGRQELENHMSHWGRGSVRLRVQWIYSISALLQYFVLIAETRLSNARRSLEGMSQQLAKAIAEDEKKRAFDHFETVRIQELVSLSSNNMKSRVAQIQKQKKSHGGVVKKLIVPLRPLTERGRKSGKPVVSDKRPQLHAPPAVATGESLPFASPSATAISRRRLNSANDAVSHLEDQISQQRQRFLSSHIRLESTLALQNKSGRFTPQVFKSWPEVCALLLDRTLIVGVVDNEIKIRHRKRANETSNEIEQSEIQSSVLRKLSPPRRSPKLLQTSISAYMQSFMESRRQFDRVSKMNLSTVLNPGGWLTIRPVTALNLPETYHGMFVKVKYGAVNLVSETVDAKVVPVWSKRNSSQHPSRDSPFRRSMKSDSLSSSDMHIHVAPQKTSGSIRISVVGERNSQKKLQSRVELGVVHLPLGACIAACIDCQHNDSVAAGYLRWFPLTNPKKVFPMEGDGGLGTRPPDTEQERDDTFDEYFAPCLQLLLSWSPQERENVVSGSQQHQQINEHDFKAEEERPIVQSYFNADVRRFSVALIDSKRTCELLSLHVLDIDIRHWVSQEKTRVGLAVGWLQLDYQNLDSKEPVVVAPTPSDSLNPVIQSVAVKDNSRSVADVLSFDFIDISVAEFDVTIEESLLVDVLRLWHSIKMPKSTPKASASHLTDSQLGSSFSARPDAEKPSLRSLHQNMFVENHGRTRRVYIKKLYLGVLKVNLSYVKGKTAAWDSLEGWADQKLEQVLQVAGSDYLAKQAPEKSGGIDVLETWSQQTDDGADYSSASERESQNLPSFLATIFPTVSDAPVRLPGKALHHVFESPSEIFQSIRKFYTNEILKQLYKIIGSLDFVGNPTMLVTSFFSGIRDLLVTPSVAFLNSPTDPSKVGLGMAKGTLSLFSHSTSGFFGVLAKVSAATGQGVATLSLDSDFREWHRDKVVAEATNLNREWKRRGVRSAGRMIFQPLADIVMGASGGVVGVFVSPVKGYQQGGYIGFLKGIAVGGIGLVAKPTVGVIDAFAHFTASIHDIAKSVNVLEKRLVPAMMLRVPYSFGMAAILEPYDSMKAQASNLVHQFPSKSKGPAAEAVVDVEMLPSVGVGCYVVVTTTRLMLVRTKWETNGTLQASLSWNIDLSREDEEVVSRVDENGQNGISLSICKRIDQATSSRTKRRVSFLASEDDDGFEEVASLVAEYEYRGQLTRIHNAVSCVTGNVRNAVRDISSLNPESMEGYRTFGMFHFSEGGLDERTEVSSSSALERTPWISAKLFAEVSELSRDERKERLEAETKRWTLDDAIEASTWEGGEPWLVEARARVFLDHNNFSEHGGTEEELEDVNFVHYKKADKDDAIPPNSLQRYQTARMSAQSNAQSVDLQRDDNDDDDEMSLLRDGSHHYWSPQRISSKAENRKPSIRMSSRQKKKSRQSSFFSAQSCADSSSELAAPYSHHHRDSTSAHSGGTSQPSAGEERTDRLDRMEELLERLLQYSAEQAQKYHQFNLSQICEADELSHLQDEMEQLNSHQEYARSEEVAALRAEIEELKEQVRLMATNRGDLPTETIAVADNVIHPNESIDDVPDEHTMSSSNEEKELPIANPEHDATQSNETTDDDAGTFAGEESDLGLPSNGDTLPCGAIAVEEID